MTIVYPNEWEEEIEQLKEEFDIEDIEEILLTLLKKEVLRIRISSYNEQVQQDQEDHSESIQGIIEQTEGEAS